MTIGKRLYAGFGLILGILCLLLIVNLATGFRQKFSSHKSEQSLESFQSIEKVRYLVMKNRLDLNN